MPNCVYISNILKVSVVYYNDKSKKKIAFENCALKVSRDLQVSYCVSN